MNTGALLAFLRSRTVLVIGMTLLGFALIAGTFSVGMVVGYHKAQFSFAWGENYRQNFSGPRGGFLHDLGGRDFIEGHGTFGQIIQIDGGTIIISGRDGAEKTLLVTDDTTIRRLQDTVKLADLRTGDQIVIIGSPNDQGQIEAQFIRVFPAGVISPSPFQSPLR